MSPLKHFFTFSRFPFEVELFPSYFWWLLQSYGSAWKLQQCIDVFTIKGKCYLHSEIVPSTKAVLITIIRFFFILFSSMVIVQMKNTTLRGKTTQLDLELNQKEKPCSNLLKFEPYITLIYLL